MTQVIASIPATALETVNQPWRNQIHVMGDGYRAIVFSDGSNIKVTSAATGASWSTPTTIVGGTMTTLVDSVVCGNTLALFLALPTFIICHMLPYNGAGAFGAVTNSQPVSALPYTPQSVRAVYDPNATTSDTQHTTGTGICHLVVDAGGTWYIYALDFNTSATKPKSTLTASIANGITTPTYATNAIMRTQNKVYILSSAGSNGWRGCELSYNSVTSTGTQSTGSSPTNNQIDMGAAFGSSDWFYQPSATSTPTFGVRWYAGNNVSHVGGIVSPLGINYPPSTVARQDGHTVPGYAGASIPSGSWSAVIPITAGNTTTFSISGQIRIYDLAGGVYTYIGTVSGGMIQFFATGLTSTQNLYISGSLPAHNFGATSSLYVELDLYIASGSLGEGNTSFTSIVDIGVVTLNNPAGTVGGTVTTTTNSYTAGSLESPGLPNSFFGAGLSVSGVISTNNPVDIAVNGPTYIAYMQRAADGTYSAQQNLTAPNLLTTSGVASAGNTTTGDISIFALAAFSGVQHVGVIRKTNGIWGTFAQWDTSAAAIQSNYGAVDAESIALAGNAVTYVNGPSPYNLQYEDAGYTSGAAVPTVTNVIIIPTSSTANDVFGVGPFNIVTSFPYIQFTFNETLANDEMSAWRIVVTRTDVGPSTYWDSGQVASTGTTLNGGQYTVPYGSAGSYTPLVVGGTYTIQVFAWETVGGNVSSGSSLITFTYVSAPTITVTAPSAITGYQQSFSFSYAQAQNKNTQSYDLQLFDANNVLVYDSGNIPKVIAANSTYTTPSTTTAALSVNSTVNAGSVTLVAGQGATFASGQGISIGSDKVVIGAVSGDTLYVGTYVDVVIRANTGPVVYYRLGETTGTTATDIGGNSRNGTYSGTFTLNQAGAISDGDPGILVNGKAVQYAAGTGLPTGNSARSISCWIKSGAGSGLQVILSYGAVVAKQDFGLVTGSSTNLGVDVQSAAANDNHMWTVPNWMDGFWHHTVITFDGSTVTFYLDGVSYGGVPMNAQSTTLSAAGLVIGAKSDATTPYNGYVDEVAIYNRVLPAAEVQAQYVLGKAANGTLSATHTANSDIVQTTDTAINLQGYIKNLTNYTVKVTAYTAPGSGSAWSGSGSSLMTTQLPAPPQPASFAATPVVGSTPIAGGYDLLSWTQATDNYIDNADFAITSGITTYYADPFVNTNGWDTHTGVTTTGNVATLAASTGVLSSQAYFYKNNTLTFRYFNNASNATLFDLRFMFPSASNNGYCLRFDHANTSIQFGKLVAGVFTGIGPVQNNARTASTWYWAQITFSVSGGVTTMAATFFSDSSGVMGAQFGGALSAVTDSTYTAVGGIEVLNRHATNTLQIGGASSGTAFKLTGPSPRSWTGGIDINTANQAWGGWFLEPGANALVLAARQVIADPNNPSYIWSASNQPVDGSLGVMTVQATGKGATAASGLIFLTYFASASGGQLTTVTSATQALTTSYSKVSAQQAVPLGAAYATIQIVMGHGFAGTSYAYLPQAEGGSTASAWRLRNGAILSKNNIYQRNTGTLPWTLVASVNPVVGANSLKDYYIPNGIAQDFAVSSVSANGIESGTSVITNYTLNFRVGLWLNDPVNPNDCVELGMQNAGDAFMNLEPVQDKDQAQLFNRTDMVITVGSLYSYHIPEILYQLEVGYEAACKALLKKWDQQGTVLQVRTPYGDVLQAVILSAKPGANHLVIYQTIAIEMQCSEPSLDTTPTA